MKKQITLIMAFMLTSMCWTQNGINYKAIIKDGSDNIIANDLVVVKFNILQGSESGPSVYEETHTPITNENGMVIINIGEGTPEPTSVFYADIDWGGDTHFLNVQINTGTGLVNMGTTEFKHVPYALNAVTAQNALTSADNYWNKSGSVVFNDTEDIGIGSDTLNAKLGIYSNSSLSDPQILLHENGNDYSRIRMQNNNGENYWTIAAYIASNNRNDRLNFWNGTSGDVMTITGDGEVGIGVGISPKVDFHVGNQRRVLFGIDTLGAGDKLMFLPDLHAFRVGTLGTGAASPYWNNQIYYDDFHEQNMNYIGLYSFASGYNTRAQGYGATAMGRDTEASNSYAMATGYFTNADGLYSTAMGFNTDAFATGSTALGYSTDAEANYSFAAGYFAEAQAIYSTAIGRNTQAQSYASTAIGSYNVGGGSATTWQSFDPIFEVGIGSSSSNRANAMTIRKDGRVGIGTAFPASELQVNGRIQFQTVEYFEDGGTNEITARGDIRPSADNLYDLGTSTFRWDDVYATNGTIQTSDERDKTNMKDLNYGLESIMNLKPISFNWKNRPNQEKKLGLVAQDLLEVIPEVVKTHDWQDVDESDNSQKKRVKMDRMGVYYSDLIPVLIKAIQEQQSTIETLKSRVEILEKR